ncbi:MAG: hypothetical protein KF753_09315 [Caldilineaceae bacterium]|nr:hypothetical protein [Caldilineaceae bacterium]
MNKQQALADSATATMEEMRDLMHKQLAALKVNSVTDSIDQLVSRMETQFGYSKEDAVKSVKTLFDTYGDDVLNLIAEKTPLPIKRKKQNRNKKLMTALTVAMGVIAVARWFLNNSSNES